MKPRRFSLPALYHLGSVLILMIQVFVCGCSVEQPRGVQPVPDHLFLISIDTLRPDYLGCYGNPEIHTPNIDRLAKNSTQFKLCSVPLGRTNPSVASLLTSKYPQDHQVRSLWDTLSETEETIADTLKAQGFSTAFINGNSLLGPKSGITQGFDTYDGPRAGIVQFFKKPSTAAQQDSPYSNTSTLATQTDSKPEKSIASQQKQHNRAGWKADRITATALKRLGMLETVPNMFMWVHYMDPHWSYSPPAPWSKLYCNPNTQVDMAAVFNLSSGELRYHNTMSEPTRQYFRDLYAGEIAYTDFYLGKFLREIGHKRLLDSSVIALTSDHGEALGEKGMYFCHGDEVYRESINVPLIISSGNPANSEVHLKSSPVSSLSIVSRLLDRLKIVSSFQEISRPVIFAETDAWSIKDNSRKHFPGIKGKWRMAKDDRYKLIRIPHPDGDLYEMYDLERDPAEKTNIAGTGLPREEELSGLLDQWISSDPLSDYASSKPTPKSNDLQEKLRTLGYIQ